MSAIYSAKQDRQEVWKMSVSVEYSDGFKAGTRDVVSKRGEETRF